MRGIPIEQDSRFKNKDKLLIKNTKFPKGFDIKVDISKVNMEVIKIWISNRIKELTETDDDLIADYTVSLLETKDPDPKQMQIQLAGFMTIEKSSIFMIELWKLLVDAQSSTSGTPQALLEMEQERIRKEQEEQEKIGKKIKEKFHRNPNNNSVNNNSNKYYNRFVRERNNRSPSFNKEESNNIQTSDNNYKSSYNSNNYRRSGDYRGIGARGDNNRYQSDEDDSYYNNDNRGNYYNNNYNDRYYNNDNYDKYNNDRYNNYDDNNDYYYKRRGKNDNNSRYYESPTIERSPYQSNEKSSPSYSSPTRNNDYHYSSQNSTGKRKELPVIQSSSEDEMSPPRKLRNEKNSPNYNKDESSSPRDSNNDNYNNYSNKEELKKRALESMKKNTKSLH